MGDGQCEDLLVVVRQRPDIVRRHQGRVAHRVGGHGDDVRDGQHPAAVVAHVIAVPAEALGETAVVATDDVGPLAYDHEEILALAVAHVRAAYREHPDPWSLLGDRPFTLLELERLHRAVDPHGTPLRDTFRRAMEPQLVATGEFERGTVGKPARLFARTTEREAQP